MTSRSIVRVRSAIARNVRWSRRGFVHAREFSCPTNRSRRGSRGQCRVCHPSLFSVRMTLAGERRLPFTATQLPDSKFQPPRTPALFGASSVRRLSLEHVRGRFGPRVFENAALEWKCAEEWRSHRVGFFALASTLMPSWRSTQASCGGP